MAGGWRTDGGRNKCISGVAYSDGYVMLQLQRHLEKMLQPKMARCNRQPAAKSAVRRKS